MKVGVIDYGVGNLGSVMRALEDLRVTPKLIARPSDMRFMDRLILPGVGNFGDCSRLLMDGGWFDALREEVNSRDKYLLGVCLGMQLLASYSSEGASSSSEPLASGLGFIPGSVQHLGALGCALRVPHIGWNGVRRSVLSAGLFDGIADETDFYFVHSYAFVTDDPQDILATTDYGVRVTAAVRRGRVWGTQFHPEKSSRAGFRLLRNFIDGHAC